MRGTESTGGVQVIARAAQVLRALEGEPHGLSLARLAERVALPRSTVHRIVTALAAEGLLASVSSTGGVRIGPEFARQDPGQLGLRRGEPLGLAQPVGRRVGPVLALGP